MDSQRSDSEPEAEPAPKAIVTVEFSGPDGMTFTIKATMLTSAQWAMATAVVGYYSQQALAVAQAETARRAIVPASAMPAGAIPASLADLMRKASRG